MRYWQEMRSKGGFSDGEAVPDGAEVYREVYLRAVNLLAKQLGSRVRAVAYDRPGVHNWCLVLFRDAGNLAGEEVGEDDAMHEALERAATLPLDDYVCVTVKVSAAFDAYLAALTAMPEDEW